MKMDTGSHILSMGMYTYRWFIRPALKPVYPAITPVFVAVCSLVILIVSPVEICIEERESAHASARDSSFA